MDQPPQELGVRWEDYFHSVYDLISQGDLLNAERKIKQGLEEFPFQLNLLCAANDVHRALGERGKSLEYARLISVHYPEHFDGYARAAQDLCEMRAYADAVAQIQHGLIKFPTEYWTLWTAALIYRSSGNLEMALEYDSQIVNCHPQRFEGYYHRCSDFLALGRRDEALLSLQQGIDCLPESLELLRFKAELLLQESKAIRHRLNATSASLGSSPLISAGITGEIVKFIDFDTEFEFIVENPADVIQLHYLRGSLYENEELKIIRRYSHPADRFLDIGANVGNHAIFMAKVLHACEVICFEPVPYTARLLSINAKLNNCASVLNLSYLGIAAGSQVGETAFVEQVNNRGGARATNSTEGHSDTLVPIIPIDRLEIQGRINFVKIDIEGMELFALHGMQRLIQNWKPTMFIEVSDTNANEFHLWCTSFGYTIADRFKRYQGNENFLLVHESRLHD
jgi:FkbM family methyltransferase